MGSQNGPAWDESLGHIVDQPLAPVAPPPGQSVEGQLLGVPVVAEHHGIASPVVVPDPGIA